MDFGIARAVADTSATMTQMAAVIGTSQYLSPEQARGETVNARSDIYSAGCLLYELLVGRPPFVGDSPVSVAYQRVREQPAPPSQLEWGITPDIDAITLKALAKTPTTATSRFGSSRTTSRGSSPGSTPPRRGASEPRPAPRLPNPPTSRTGVSALGWVIRLRSLTRMSDLLSTVRTPLAW
jgi:eukaryotic-like serine/threonine-protein kinase